MPWKKDDNGAFVADENGNPIFTLDGGEDKSVDYAAMSKALADANRESAGRKETIRKLEAAAKVWGDIEDVPGFIADAHKNAEAVKAMSDKEKTAEEATRARIMAATAPLEKKIAELEADNARVVEQYHASTIRSQFGTSEYVNKELVSAGMAQELFARHFSVDENGNIVGRDAAGSVIYDENGVAGFDAALRKIVAASPHKAFVVKGSDANGSGAKPNNNGGSRINTENMTSVQLIAAGLKAQGGMFAR